MFQSDLAYPKIIVKEIVGIGSFGIVYRGLKKEPLGSDEKVVAVKQIKIDWNSDSDFLRNIMREVRILSEINHTNLLAANYIRHDGPFIYVVTSFCFSDLLKIVETSKTYKKVFTETRDILWVIVQLFSGLNYLHKCDLVHRDLKPENVLVTSDLTIKICDFGSARNAGTDKCDAINIWYAPPELILSSTASKICNEAQDVWSLGCVIFELIAREPLFPVTTARQQMDLHAQFLGRAATRRKKPKILSTFENSISQARLTKDIAGKLIEFLGAIFVHDPSVRISCDKALQSELFQKLERGKDDESRRKIDFGREERACEELAKEDTEQGSVDTLRSRGRPHQINILDVDDMPSDGKFLKRALKSEISQINRKLMATSSFITPPLSTPSNFSGPSPTPGLDPTATRRTREAQGHLIDIEFDGAPNFNPSAGMYVRRRLSSSSNSSTKSSESTQTLVPIDLDQLTGKRAGGLVASGFMSAFEYGQSAFQSIKLPELSFSSSRSAGGGSASGLGSYGSFNGGSRLPPHPEHGPSLESSQGDAKCSPSPPTPHNSLKAKLFVPDGSQGNAKCASPPTSSKSSSFLDPHDSTPRDTKTLPALSTPLNSTKSKSMYSDPPRVLGPFSDSKPHLDRDRDRDRDPSPHSSSIYSPPGYDAMTLLGTTPITSSPMMDLATVSDLVVTDMD